MTLLRNLSVRSKIALGAVGAAALGLLLSGAVLIPLYLEVETEERVEEGSVLTEMVAFNTAAAVAFADADDIASVLASLAASEGVQHAEVYDAGGRLLATWPSGTKPLGPPGPVGHRFIEDALVVVRPIGTAGQRLGTVVVSSSVEPIRKEVRTAFAVMAGAAIFGILVAAAAAYVLQRNVTRRLLSLADAAATVTRDADYSVRVVNMDRDELGTLTDAFNGMLGQIERRDAELETKVGELQAEIAEHHRTQAALKESEEQLLQAQKMEAVGRLAGGVAHDFNNILTTIRGYTELVLARTALDDTSRNRLQEVARGADRAAGLTRQLLAFSRKQILEARVLDPNAVVRGMEPMLRSLVGETIALEFSLTATSRLKADPVQIEQVILNLAVNARDAMADGGRLRLAVDDVVLREDRAGPLDVPPGPYVRLQVTDTGSGMSREVMERIFEPFFTTKPLGKGTGLGLSTVYGIVKQSAGGVRCESVLGCGTTFTVLLPALSQVCAPAAPAQAKGPAAAKGDETILLVEDERQVRELMLDALQVLGYSVLVATDGQEALERFREEPARIDLLMTDLVMPRMGGRELYEALLAARPGLVALFMSGYTADAAARKAVAEATVSFLQKPFTPQDLSLRLRELLETPRALGITARAD